MRTSRRVFLTRIGSGGLIAGAAGAAGLAARGPVRTAGASSHPAAAGQWQGPFSMPLVAIHAILLRTGRVLFLYGDHQARGSLISLWDPVSNLYTSVPAPSGLNPFCSGHCQLSTGHALVAGGHIEFAGVGDDDYALFNPSPAGWSATAKMRSGRWYPTCTALADGSVLVTSGGDANGSANAVPEIYTPGTPPALGASAWQQLPMSAWRQQPFYPFMFVLPTGNVFNAGPNADGSVLNLSTNTWGAPVPAPGLPAPNWPAEATPAVTWVTHDAAGLPTQSVLVTGGYQSSDPGNFWATNAARRIVFDANGNTTGWQQAAAMLYARLHHSLVLLPDGTVLCLGGSYYHENVNARQLVAEAYTPATNSWTPWAKMKRLRMHHSVAIFLPDGRVLMAGGDRQSNMEIFSPPYLFNADNSRRTAAQRPRITGTPLPAVPRDDTNSTNETFTIGVTLPGGMIFDSVALLAPGAMTHCFDQHQRHVRLHATVSNGVATVSKPRKAVAPPGYYMLFVIGREAAGTTNEKKVPSVGEWIRFQ